MRKKLLYIYVAGLILMMLGCSPSPVPSVDAVINQGCLFDNSKYCGWRIFIREDHFWIRCYGVDTITGIIDRDYDDTIILKVYPKGQYDSVYHVAYSLWKNLTSMAAALYSDFDYYANYPDTNGHFRFARMDFYNKDYDTIITLFQIDSAIFVEHDMANRFNLKSLAKDWYTRMADKEMVFSSSDNHKNNQ